MSNLNGAPTNLKNGHISRVSRVICIEVICPNCGAKVGRNAAFCSACGGAVPPGAPAAAPNSGRSVWMGALITFAAVALGLAGLNAAGMLHLGRPQTAPVLPTIVQKPKPVLDEPAPQNTKMPDDIRDWLEHLRRTEEKRIDLTKEQIRHLTIASSEFQASSYADTLKALLDDGSENRDMPPEDASKKKAADIVDAVRPEWKDLAESFETRTPPEECREMAAKYDQALRETGATTGDIIDTMYNLGSDPHQTIAKLEEIMKNHKERIDKPAAEVDDAVAAICRKYDTRKWFDIHSDIGAGGSGILALPSIPGVGLSP